MIIYRTYEKNIIWREKMKKKLLTLAVAAIMTVASVFTAMADTKTTVTSVGPWADSTGEVSLTGDFDVTYTFHTETTYPNADSEKTALNTNYDTFGVEVRDGGVNGFTIRADYFGWGFGTWSTIALDTWSKWSCTDTDALEPGSNNMIDWTDWTKTFMSADVTINIVREGQSLTIKMLVEGDNGITYDITAPITTPVEMSNTITVNIVVPSAGAEEVDASLVSTVKFTDVEFVDNNAEPPTTTQAPTTQAPSTDDTQAPTTVPSANGKDPEVVTTAPSGEKDTTAAEKDTTAAVGEKDTTAAGQKDTTAAGEKDTTAEQQTTTVDSTNIAVSDEEAAKLEDSAKVEGDKLDKDVALKVSKVEDKVVEAVKEAAKEVLKDKVYATVDLKLVKGTEVVQANGDVKVTINVPEKVKNAKVIEVFRLDADKLVSLGKADVKDGKISFTTNHFSTYVFADVTPAATDSEPGGDTAPVMMLLAIAAVAGAAVVASKKKNVTE